MDVVLGGDVEGSIHARSGAAFRAPDLSSVAAWTGTQWGRGVSPATKAPPYKDAERCASAPTPGSTPRFRRAALGSGHLSGSGSAWGCPLLGALSAWPSVWRPLCCCFWVSGLLVLRAPEPWPLCPRGYSGKAGGPQEGALARDLCTERGDAWQSAPAARRAPRFLPSGRLRSHPLPSPAW